MRKTAICDNAFTLREDSVEETSQWRSVCLKSSLWLVLQTRHSQLYHMSFVSSAISPVCVLTSELGILERRAGLGADSSQIEV